jgi:hypothetical protein
MVRFAMICDHCGKRSPEYGGWPTCRECGDHVCLGCIVPESDDADCDHYDATCLKCGKCSRCDKTDDTGSGLCRACWSEDFPPEVDYSPIDLEASDL